MGRGATKATRKPSIGKKNEFSHTPRSPAIASVFARARRAQQLDKEQSMFIQKCFRTVSSSLCQGGRQFLGDSASARPAQTNDTHAILVHHKGIFIGQQPVSAVDPNSSKDTQEQKKNTLVVHKTRERTAGKRCQQSHVPASPCRTRCRRTPRRCPPGGYPPARSCPRPATRTWS